MDVTAPRARSTTAILDATRDLLAEAGYRGLTIEAVAARAGVGKATIYRWWGGREELVVDALSGLFTADEIPDLGDTRGELARAVRMTLDTYTGDAFALTLPALAADCAGKPEVMQRLRERFLRRRRDRVAAALRRAADRGDLPGDLDTELVQDVWSGTIAYRRVISGGALDDALVDRLVDLVLHGAPLRTGG